MSEAKMHRGSSLTRRADVDMADLWVPEPGEYPMRDFLAVVAARRFLEQEAEICAATPAALCRCPSCGNTTHDNGHAKCARCRKLTSGAE